MASATLEEATPSGLPFKLELRSDRCATALVLYLNASLGEAIDAPSEAATISMAPLSRQFRDKSPAHLAQQTVLHLPAPGPPPADGLTLQGSEFSVIEGTFSASWAPRSSRLEIVIELV